MKNTLPCDCGGSLRPDKVATYDFSPFADGLQVTIENVPVLRCDRCGELTLDGAIIDGTLNAVAQSIATAEGRLGGVELRFLRKHLLMTQQELATQVGCNRVTVADWERDAQPISEQHELHLRALVLGGKELKENDERFSKALLAAFAAARDIQPDAERILSNALALLSRAAQQPPSGAAKPTQPRVIKANALKAE